MKGLTKRLLVISLDAVSSEDFTYLRTLPNFSRLMDTSAICTNVHSVYPSVTYPAHTSIITGKYPGRHGIVNNTFIQPNRKSPDWFWQRKYIQGTTLYDEMIKDNKVVAALLWPVTAGAQIQYNLPEIFANRPWTNQIITSMANGSVLYSAILNKKFGHLRKGKQQPYLDNFVHECVKYTLEICKPDLTLVHFTDVDTHKHIYGTKAAQVFEALNRHDRRIGEILDTLDQHGLMDETTLVILGDHSQLDARKVIYLNRIFWDRGLIKIRRDKMVHWHALCKNCDGCAYIYVKSREMRPRVYELLKHLKASGQYGIGHIFTHREAVAQGADPMCAFMVEAEEGCYFLDDWEKSMEDVENLEPSDHRMMATHGYHPDRENYQTFFMASGPGIRAGAVVEQMSLVDEGPTLARLVGVDLGTVDGHVINEILLDGRGDGLC